MLFINDIVQNIKADSNDIFTVDDMQLFLLLYCDDAVVFAKITRSFTIYALWYRNILYTMGLEN